MKYVVAAAIMAMGLYALTARDAGAGTEPGQVLEHHNTQHSLGPCGIYPCPDKSKDGPQKKRKAR